MSIIGIALIALSFRTRARWMIVAGVALIVADLIVVNIRFFA